jgi:Zn-dependent protease with chaperone function
VNFFEQQDHARRRTRWLVVLFVLAVFAIVLVVDFALVLGFGIADLQAGVTPLSAEGLAANLPLLIGGSVATTTLVGLASLFRTAALKGGGGKVARDLGGTLVDADSRDPLRRRLRNVVEEIALASGVPVPEVYVLEQESGINAFAAGYTPTDAAIAVTRGAMEKLSRSELQGVIAHEFSHIFNGDMRLNIRLMGALFGILVLALIGRKVLYHTRYMGRSRDNSGAAILLVAFALMVVGYIGLFFGRWIKAAVSRQREFLADASAVQFTRDPDGIGGALKKIAVYSEASYLDAETEEVAHMLFGAGRKMHLFATHPPLRARIRRIDRNFRDEDLETLADRIRRTEQRAAERAAAEQAQRETVRPGAFDAGQIMSEIGNPRWDRLLLAAAIAASIPEPVKRAAHSADWAPEVLFYTLLDSDSGIREQQLLAVAQHMGSDSETRVRGLLKAAPVLDPEQRLPLMEVALPSLKRHPPAFVKKVMDTVTRLIQVDGEIDVFEYLLARVVSQYLWEAMNPHSVRTAGRRRIAGLEGEVRMVLAVLATHGDEDPERALRAYAEGMQRATGTKPSELPDTRNWIALLDAALRKLDDLRHEDKEVLVRAMIETVTADGRLVVAELELMRAVCASLHVPMPMVSEVARDAGASPAPG